MKRWSYVVRTVAAIAIFATTSQLIGGVVDNPIKEKVKKGDITVELQLVAAKFSSPMKVVSPGDDSRRTFIVDQTGQVYAYKQWKALAKPFLDISGRLVKIRKGFDERGLLSLAFHPGFADSKSAGYKKLYTYSSEPVDPKAKTHKVKIEVAGQAIPPDHQAVITEWQVKNVGDLTVDMSTRKEIMRIDQPQFNHDGGDITFGPDGMLYIALGDGGAANDSGPGHSEGGNGQDNSNLLGTIVRIDPLGKVGKASSNGNYSIPNDNPFVGKKGLDEIYAYGMRNPFRISFDPATKMLISGDIGQEDIEEVNIIKKGGNYGWPVKEGDLYFIPPSGRNKGQVSTEPHKPVGENMKFIGPKVQYDHDDGISVIGGFVYHGKKIPELKGKYVFGEWSHRDLSLPKKEQNKPNGRLFFADLKKGTIKELRIGKNDRKLGECVTGFGVDDNGELYVLTNNHRGPTGTGGKAYQIIPAK